MYVMCVNNESNPESLELRKIYQAMPDVEGGGTAIFGSSTKRAKATCIPRDTSSW